MIICIGCSNNPRLHRRVILRNKYLFAGSHDAAQRIAMMYFFFAAYKANDVNPYEWLKTTLDRIPDHPVNRLEELLPGKIHTPEEMVNV